MYDAIFFDLDGTLIDSEVANFTAGMGAFAALGLSGKPIGAGMAALEVPALDVAKVAYVAPGSKDIMVVMPDGTMAHAVLTDDATVLN